MNVIQTEYRRHVTNHKPKPTDSKPIKRIAYLEDNKTHGSYLANWLERQNVFCEVFETAELFENALSTHNYDLILLDWEMSDGSSGLETLQRIRKSPGSEIPAIFVSSRNTRDAILTAIRHGADDYLAKPVHRSELLTRIRTLTEKRKLVGTTYQYGPYLIDRKLCHVYLKGKIISLTPREYNLAVAMFKNHGKVLSHEYLLSVVGGEETLKPYQEIEYLLNVLKKKLKINEVAELRVERIGDMGFRLLKCK